MSYERLRVKYLVDANLLSEGVKSSPALATLDWLRDHRGQIAVNPVILGELHYGILILPPGRRRTQLRQWLADGVKGLRVLDIDANTALIWASLLAELRRKGRAMPVKDSLIAATARQYDLAVATRNSEDFRHAGVTVVNPFEE